MWAISPHVVHTCFHDENQKNCAHAPAPGLSHHQVLASTSRAPDAVICFDPFHVIKLVTDALDSVRRQVWQSARRYPDKAIAKKYKGARWALLKNPQDLTEDQGDTLKALRRNGGALWRAYQLKSPALAGGSRAWC